jgi:formate hydrogenlyase subunit 6/NADH:ubiquinone oxidoreductase subunit I
MAIDERDFKGPRSAYDEGKLVPGAGDNAPPPDADPDLLRVGHDKLREQRKMTFGIGLLKGMAVTLKHLFKRNTVIEYPDEKQDLSPRTRGVIALKEENCTVCMLCGRECPDWCIYIDSHKETLPPKREGGRPRKRNVLDRFAIDYALCMYCGICVEVCPYDALFWSREFEYAEFDIRELTHEKERLSDWMATVLPPPELEVGAELPGQLSPAAAEPAAVPPTPAAAAPAPAATGTAAQSPSERVEPKSAPSKAPSAAAPSAASVSAPAATSTQSPSKAPAPAAPSAASASTTTDKPGTAESREQKSPLSTQADQSPLPDAAQVHVPTETPRPVALEKTEDPEKVYADVLKDQLDKGSSPQVAEARAKVARVKAERGIKRGPTPVQVDKPVPSAPTKSSSPNAEPSGAAPDGATATPSGAPRAEEPKPEQGPVAPTEGDGS